MSNRILITESTKEALSKELEKEFEQLTDEEIIEKAKESKNFTISYKESGEVQIKQVLLG